MIDTVADGVYAPREDSALLVDVMYKTGLALGSKVADLCTGSGVIAINAVAQGAARVSAFDICAKACCARANRAAARGAGRRAPRVLGAGRRVRALRPCGVQSPYVPNDPHCESLPSTVGPARAWDAGSDGRLILDPLCEAVPGLLADGGSLLLVFLVRALFK